MINIGRGFSFFNKKTNCIGHKRQFVSTKSVGGRSNQHDLSLISRLDGTLSELKENGLYKEERIITSPMNPLMEIQTSPTTPPRKVINFCANNYLGLSDNKEIIEEGKQFMDKYGNGLSSVRFICGTQNIHKQLEQKIADFHQKEDSILYASCFDANGGLFESLLGPNDVILSDELNHASIIDGIRLCKAQKYRFKHLDLSDLERGLEANKNAPVKMIVTDGVFSMDGEIAPLDKICDLADKYGALVMIDDCHATGFLGKTGRGTAEYHNVLDRVDIINSTLGKALGGAMGGFTTGKKQIIEILRQRSRPYLFSNTLPPSIIGSTLKVFDIISENTSLRDQLEKNTNHFRKEIISAGFDVIGKDHPITPLMIYDARIANVFARDMLKRGIYVVGFSFPVVPKEKARIRIQLSAAHTKENIDQAIEAFIAVGKEHKIIK
eukprot:TRINITY_DN1765_c0_g1_i1.p1 TRINITY_DN1765_c0_g1~~TRINITY_DN1765_c0_g1_i1.p1  ORF type:complete len:438 (-),score=81.34 TRINITY_DN1765_c0_g1_i1:135-1448(-)